MLGCPQVLGDDASGAHLVTIADRAEQLTVLGVGG
jgi:hypothetical protein